VKLLLSGILVNTFYLSFVGVVVSVIMSESVGSYQGTDCAPVANTGISVNTTEPTFVEGICEDIIKISYVHYSTFMAVVAMYFLQAVVMKPKEAPRKHFFAAFLVLGVFTYALLFQIIDIFGRYFYFYYGVAFFLFGGLGIFLPLIVKFVYRRYMRKIPNFKIANDPHPLNSKQDQHGRQIPKEKLSRFFHVTLPGILFACYGSIYNFYLIPHYRRGNGMTRFVLRVVIHPFLLILGDGLLRSFALKKHKKSTIPTQLRSLHITAYDLFFQLIGRVFMSMDMDNNQFALFCTVVVGLQEYALRKNAIKLELLFERALRYKASDLDKKRLRVVLAHDSISSMSAELSAIIISFVCRLLFYRHKVIFDLGYREDSPPDLWGEGTLLLFSLCVELLVDVFSMSAELKLRLPLEDVWNTRTKTQIIWECVVITSAVLACMVFYRISPTWGFCEDALSACSCPDLVRSSEILSDVCLIR